MPRRNLFALTTLCAAATLAMGCLMIGPNIEASLWPIRTSESITFVQRDANMIRFTLASKKLRDADLYGVKVELNTPADRFLVTLNKDLSLPKTPCIDIVPVGSQGVGIGSHTLNYCVEVPRTVNGDDKLTLSIKMYYRGLWGLWSISQSMPEIDVPADSSPIPASSEPMAAWGD